MPRHFHTVAMWLLAAASGLGACSSPCLSAPDHVIVIAMENKDAFPGTLARGNFIYGNEKDAPFINDVLLPQSARAANFVDELIKERSQPHYIMLEAGRVRFDDTHFTCNSDPSRRCDLIAGPRNWTTSGTHLTAQIEARQDPGVTWMTYQEDIDPGRTGACPIHSAGLYAAKHNPFVYFSDVSGNPPDENNAHCRSHTRDLRQFAPDMASGQIASYVFITPNLCHDMHGASGCPKNKVAAGDTFLRSFLPPILEWSKTNKAVIFIVWDEGSASKLVPFIAAGWGVRPGHVSTQRYVHRSLPRTVEHILDLPVLDSVKDAPVLEDLFLPGILP